MTREDAIKVIKQAMPTLWKETKEAIQTLIPELAESEDERIRKEMIEFLNQYKEDGLRGVDITAWIAYLKKQKEIASCGVDEFTLTLRNCLFADSELTKEQADIFAAAYGEELLNVAVGKIKSGLTKEDNTDFKTEKQKGQKSAECISDSVQFDEGFKTGREVGFREGVESVKPAEWDFPYGVSKIVDKLITIAECLEMDGDCLFNGYSGTKCGKFLRDLARKEVECKPVEWSEEEIDKVVIYLHERDGGMLWSKAKEIASDICDILHPQSQWKPSKEQIKALTNLIKGTHPNIVPTELSELLAKLKQLYYNG